MAPLPDALVPPMPSVPGCEGRGNASCGAPGTGVRAAEARKRCRVCAQLPRLRRLSRRLRCLSADCKRSSRDGEVFSGRSWRPLGPAAPSARVLTRRPHGTGTCACSAECDTVTRPSMAAPARTVAVPLVDPSSVLAPGDQTTDFLRRQYFEGSSFEHVAL